MHNINKEFCLEIHTKIVFSMNRIDYKMLCFKILHFVIYRYEGIYNSTCESNKKKYTYSPVSKIKQVNI